MTQTLVRLFNFLFYKPMSQDDNKQVAVATVQMPSFLAKRLQQKMVERHEEEILDYLEQIQMHKDQINKLIEKINTLAGSVIVSMKKDAVSVKDNAIDGQDLQTEETKQQA